MEIIRLENITKSYFMNGGEIRALRDVNFTIDAGDILVILGPSGSGKSTLLSLLGGLSSPSHGEVFCKDKSLYKMPGAELSNFRNKVFGFVFQFHHLMPELTAVENVILPGWIGRRDPSDCRKRAEKLLKHVGLGNRMNHKPSELSGGEQQRVAVCRALMNEPEIILADEPTGNLDFKTAEGVHDILWDLCQKEGRTLIVVTHYEPLAKKADHVLTLEGGLVTKKRNISERGGEDVGHKKKGSKDEISENFISGQGPEIELASRWKRLLAYMIDCALLFPAFLTSGSIFGFELNLQNLNYSGIYTLLSVLFILVVSVLNLILLVEEGKTIGKWFMRIRFVEFKTGEIGSFLTNVIVRNLWSVVGLSAFFVLELNGKEIIGTVVLDCFILFDVLPIFSHNRRCLHDYIAGTKVVKG